MKLLIINDYGISGGGTENRIKLLVEELLSRKTFEEIHILSYANNNKDTEKLKFHTCKTQKESFFLAWKIIKENKIDIIQVHNTLAISPLPILAAKILLKPVLFFAHDYWPICGRRSFIPAENASQEILCTQTQIKKCIKCVGWKTVLKLKIFKKIVNLCTVGISSSDFLAKIYENEGTLQNKWKIILPWIDLSKFAQHENSLRKENIILFVGSLIEFKGAWVAVKALKYVLKEIPDAKLAIIGDSQEEQSIHRNKIENIINTDLTGQNILFLGKKNWDEIKEWHKKSKVFIFPTVCMETFGLAWAEAMASGCPVIASSIGSVPELLNNKGILVKPRDEIELANAIIKVLKDENLQNKMSDEGINYAKEQFCVKKSVEKLTTIYKNLLE